MKLRLAFLALLAGVQGCSALRFEIPDEFKGKKQIEDPPLSFAPRPSLPEPPCAA